ncbi:hypothetical protein PRZ48_003415 [Zasmidium cellare]|uniref:Uncharacterized protein n=1 Tax=Zasmidium cellare TaxID=395010 RepID=A0ABR0EV28_ZASCE|nr:hypothetical protein PRZ48_003415 [Zasmidium cellare]
MQRIHASPSTVLSNPQNARILAEEIAKKAFSMLLKPEEEIDIKMSLLAGLRQWWRDVFRTEVNVLQVANAKTFEGLGEGAVGALRKGLVEGGEVVE